MYHHVCCHRFGEVDDVVGVVGYPFQISKVESLAQVLLSLVPRPPRPAFVACSTKSGGRPGRIYHVMRAAADVMLSLLTSGFVLSPSLFFP